MIVMREGVAAGDHVGGAAFLDQRPRHVVIEKSSDNVEPLGSRHLGDVFGNIDSRRADAELLQRREKHAVVASKFEDLLRRETVGKPLRVTFEMFYQRRNRARRKGVIAKENGGIDDLENLDQTAIETDVHRQRKFLFRAERLFVFEKTARQRHLSQVQDFFKRSAVTTAACRSSH